MKVKFKSKPTKGICFDSQHKQFVSDKMVKAPKLKASHLIKEIDFSNIDANSRLDRLFGSVPSHKIEELANKKLVKMFPNRSVDLNDSRVTIISSGYLVTVEIKLDK